MHLRANVTYSVSLTVFLFTHSPTPCLLDRYSIISHHRILSISLSFFILSCSPTPYLFDSFIDHLMSWTMIILSLLFSFLLLHLFFISLSPSPAPYQLDIYEQDNDQRGGPAVHHALSLRRGWRSVIRCVLLTLLLMGRFLPLSLIKVVGSICPLFLFVKK